MANITKLAKGGAKKTTTRKTTTAKKKTAQKPVAKKTTTDERDIKAKNKVAELLKDIDLTKPSEKQAPSKSEIKEDGNNIEWLQEQLTILSDENEKLRTELGQAKEDYGKLFKGFNEKKVVQQPQSQIPLQSGDKTNENILKLFSELQNNFTGRNPEKTPWSTASIKHLLGLMVQLFPFLQQHKNY